MGQNNIRMYYHSYLESLAEKSIQESFPIVLGEEILNTDALRLLTIDSSSDYSEVGYTLVPSTNELQHSDLQTRFWSEKDEFIMSLLDADFSVETENEATWFIHSHLQSKYSDAFLLWLQDFSLQYLREEVIMVKLLQLFMCFDFEELGIAAEMISLACVHNPSLEVQDTNLSLLGHWCNPTALKIMNGLEEPADPWMRIKFRKLKEVIAERCTI